jgi:hypothetical protein
MKVIEIIAAWLIANDYDGLWNGNAECACELGDLVPCSCLSEDCRAGYKYDCYCGKHDFHIGSGEARDQWEQEQGEKKP